MQQSQPSLGELQLCNNKIFILWAAYPHPSHRLIKTFAFPSNDFPVFIFFLASFSSSRSGKREYLRAINSAVTGLTKTRGQKLTFLKDYEFNPANIHFESLTLNPSPTAILNILCKQFLHANVSAILYMMNYEQYGRSTASAQYFLQVIFLTQFKSPSLLTFHNFHQLAGYLGIPVISWNADNSGLERRASQSTLQLQLAPSIEHQAAAMLSILERYKWHQFSVVTSQIAGHDDFVQAVREHVVDMQDRFKFTILNSIIVTRSSDLVDLVNSEARVMLLYCTKGEAIDILKGEESSVERTLNFNFVS